MRTIYLTKCRPIKDLSASDIAELTDKTRASQVDISQWPHNVTYESQWIVDGDTLLKFTELTSKTYAGRSVNMQLWRNVREWPECFDAQYRNLLSEVSSTGFSQIDRTQVGTKSVFGKQLTFSV